MATSGRPQPNGSRTSTTRSTSTSIAWPTLHAPGRISTLHEATAGDQCRSRAWREYVHPYGGEQELRLALRASAGRRGGCSSSTGARPTDIHSGRTAAIACHRAHLAEGARRGLLVCEASEPERSDAPGPVVLGADWSVESLRSGVERWLCELPGEGGLWASCRPLR